MNGRGFFKLTKKFFKNKVILNNEHLVIQKHPAYTKVYLNNIDTLLKKNRVVYLSNSYLFRHE